MSLQSSVSFFSDCRCFVTLTGHVTAGVCWAGVGVDVDSGDMAGAVPPSSGVAGSISSTKRVSRLHLGADCRSRPVAIEVRPPQSAL